MANKTKPITFSIDSETIEAIEAFKGRTNSESTSAIIRAAIERYDFEEMDTSTAEAKQVSLRVDSIVRDKLKSVAKSQGVSIGFLLRECIMSFIAEDQSDPQPRVGKSPILTMEVSDSKKHSHPWQI